MPFVVDWVDPGQHISRFIISGWWTYQDYRAAGDQLLGQVRIAPEPAILLVVVDTSAELQGSFLSLPLLIEGNPALTHPRLCAIVMVTDRNGLHLLAELYHQVFAPPGQIVETYQDLLSGIDATRAILSRFKA